MKSAEAGAVYTLEAKYCSWSTFLEQWEPSSASWNNLECSVDVTADEVCYKKLVLSLSESSGDTSKRSELGRGSAYLHSTVTSFTSFKEAMGMTRSTEALGTFVNIEVPLRNFENVSIGMAVVTAKLEVSAFPSGTSIFDDSSIIKLSKARRERYSLRLYPLAILVLLYVSYLYLACWKSHSLRFLWSDLRQTLGAVRK